MQIQIQGKKGYVFRKGEGKGGNSENIQTCEKKKDLFHFFKKIAEVVDMLT